MQALMDDSVVLIVYTLMLALIIAIFFVAYRLYKKREAAQRVNKPVGSEKLTSAEDGDPSNPSRYEKYND